MKKILFTLAIIAAIILGTTSISNATTRFYVKIIITDNTCTPQPYSGYYCVQWQITFQGNQICNNFTRCDLVKGTQCIAFDCDVASQSAMKDYDITFVSAVRYPGLTCGPGSGYSNGPFYWDEVTDPNCVAELHVTL